MMSSAKASSPTAPPSDGLASALTRNIDVLSKRKRQGEQRASGEDRVATAITGFAGSMMFVYVHAVLIGGWVLVNLGLTPIHRFDPSFVVLATVASVEAIFLSTFILISQNRASAAADRRADLDLQISLLAEHEVTHLIKLVSSIAERLGIDDAQSPELQELKRTVAPEAVLDRIEASSGTREENGS
jgi:uncharacterized membrane protein